MPAPRLQRTLALLERMCTAKLLSAVAAMDGCQAYRHAAIAAAARTRTQLFDQRELPGLACYLTWAHTAREASVAARLSQRHAQLQAEALGVLDERRHWMRCRIGLERRALRMGAEQHAAPGARDAC